MILAHHLSFIRKSNITKFELKTALASGIVFLQNFIILCLRGPRNGPFFEKRSVLCISFKQKGSEITFISEFS